VEVGDLVKNLNSESRMTGIIVDWHHAMTTADPNYLVLWTDGRCSWILPRMMEVVR